MSSQPESHQSTLSGLSELLLNAVSHDLTHDPDYRTRAFHDHNEANSELMTRIVIEAHRQAGDDIGKQASFVRGAEFILSALDRHEKITSLDALFEQEVSTDGEAGVDIPLFSLDEEAA